MRPLIALWLATGLLLASCGGGGGDAPTPPPSPVISPRQGDLLQASLLAELPLAEFEAALAAAGPRAPRLQPRYAVRAWRLVYRTLDGSGRLVEASGLVAVPTKAGASPVLGYQHGTITRDAKAPSNRPLPGEAPLLMAAAGYLVVAPDYVGYGHSKGLPHPYLLAAPSAAAVLDLLTAAARWRREQGIADNGQLFLAGYSEGGYATLAALRALQQENHALRPQWVAGIVGGGPYHVGATLDGLLGRVRDENPLLAALLSPGLLKHLGSGLRQEVRDKLLAAALGDNADVSFQPNFIDNYLADDTAAIERDSNVHNWRPEQPLRLFHGRADATVPYVSALRTLQAMQARGTPAVLVTLSDCSAPSATHAADHLGCVLPFWNFMLAEIGARARDL